jgi:hypothetical protein
MSLPNVTMQLPAGTIIPTKVHLPDATTVVPNAAGQISVPSNMVTVLIEGGWQIVVSSGTTHVP